MVPHFMDETYGDVKTTENNVRGHIVRGLNIRGHNLWGRMVPVPLLLLTRLFQTELLASASIIY
jgi:hypothetical protein